MSDYSANVVIAQRTIGELHWLLTDGKLDRARELTFTLEQAALALRSYCDRMKEEKRVRRLDKDNPDIPFMTASFPPFV